jgi:hypothetical protein
MFEPIPHTKLKFGKLENNCKWSAIVSYATTGSILTGSAESSVAVIELVGVSAAGDTPLTFERPQRTALEYLVVDAEAPGCRRRWPGRAGRGYGGLDRRDLNPMAERRITYGDPSRLLPGILARHCAQSPPVSPRARRAAGRDHPHLRERGPAQVNSASSGEPEPEPDRVCHRIPRDERGKHAQRHPVRQSRASDRAIGGAVSGTHRLGIDSSVGTLLVKFRLVRDGFLSWGLRPEGAME